MSRMSDDSPILDLGYLRVQTAGDDDLERELIALFMTQSARLLPLIQEGGGSSLARADVAHTFKGSARGIGAERLASVADRLEAGLRNGESEPALASLMALFEETLEATRRALAGHQPASKG